MIETKSKHGGRTEVRLETKERRAHLYMDRLVDQGWDLGTALRYAARRFGPFEPAFQRWHLAGSPGVQR